MDHSELTLPDYWRIIRRRKYLILIITGITAILAIIFTRPPEVTYSADALIEIVQKNTVAGLLLSDMLFYGEGDNIATQSKIISSQRIVFNAAQRIDLIDSEIEFDDLSSHPQYFNILNSLQGSVEAKPLGLNKSTMMTDIIQVSSVSQERGQALRLVNAIVDVYKEESVKQRNAEIVDSKDFIESQLTAYTNKLEESENNLLKYVQSSIPDVEYGVGDVLELQMSYGQLSGQLEQLREIRNNLIKRKRQEIGFEDWSALIVKYPDGDKIFSNLIQLEKEKSKLLSIQVEQSPQAQELESKIITSIDAALVSTDKDLKKLESQARATKTLLERNIEYERLQRDVELNESIVEHLSTSFQDALIKASKDFDNVRVVEYATVERTSTGSALTIKILMVVLIGFFLSIIVVVILDVFDTSIVVIDDVEKFLDLPVLAVIPHIKSNIAHNPSPLTERFVKEDIDYTKSLGLITHFKPKSPIAESYRTLRTNIDYVRSSKEGNSILFTSSSLQEGKSTTISNLAITLAQMGNRVLLVGCNLRRPSVYRTFGLDRKPGMTEILHGMIPWSDAVKNITDMFVGNAVGVNDLLLSPGLDNINIITAGSAPANPAELLATPRFKEFLEEVKEEYDVVLVDAPPTLPVTDSAIIAPNCDYTVIIYQIGRVARGMLGRTKSMLEKVEANLLGVVLNDIKAELHHTPSGTTYTQPYYGEDKGSDVLARAEKTIAEEAGTSSFVKNPLGFIKGKFNKS